MEHQKITIAGAGSWGSALAFLLGGKGYAVTLWDRDADLIRHIQTQGHNPTYLPEIELGSTVTATVSLEDALSDAGWLIVAVASGGVRRVVADAADFLGEQTAVLSVTKGLDADTGLTMSEVIATLLGDNSYAGIAVLSGPNLAGELVRGIPSASVVASDDPALARRAQAMLMTERTFRVYTHADVKGVELGGAPQERPRHRRGPVRRTGLR